MFVVEGKNIEKSSQGRIEDEWGAGCKKVGGKSDLNHHFTGVHSSVQKTPALKGK